MIMLLRMTGHIVQRLKHDDDDNNDDDDDDNENDDNDDVAKEDWSHCQQFKFQKGLIVKIITMIIVTHGLKTNFRQYKNRNQAWYEQ